MSELPPASNDPFKEHRKNGPVLKCPFQGEELPMILRHADVREAAKDWETYSSDAPFRVPIPSEEEVRTMRQLPIEVDPPQHTAYRKIADPFFRRPKKEEMITQVGALFDEMVTAMLQRESFEAVSEFALPIQSRALTYLLNVDESEADIWIGWGIHVFKVSGGPFKKGNALEDYLQAKFDEVEKNPGEDFFSALTQATFEDRPLTREEMMGYANLAFAGGRDTIIHTITSILAYFAEHPEGLPLLREDAKRINLASEEFFRVFMPLTHIGRVCPETTDVHGVEVPPGGRVSLCWSSANNDEAVFEDPHEIKLDRRPNPHVAFGFGTHLCLGAHHARLITRSLLHHLAHRVNSIEVLESVPQVEVEEEYQRSNGFDVLRISFS